MKIGYERDKVEIEFIFCEFVYNLKNEEMFEKKLVVGFLYFIMFFCGFWWFIVGILLGKSLNCDIRVWSV